VRCTLLHGFVISSGGGRNCIPPKPGIRQIRHGSRKPDKLESFLVTHFSFSSLRDRSEAARMRSNSSRTLVSPYFRSSERTAK
jgi:hypothetical protein